MARHDDFESLIAEAQAQPFIGWDFSWISKRVAIQPLPWNYRALLVKSARRSPDMLDLDTVEESYSLDFRIALNEPLRPNLIRPTCLLPPSGSIL